MMATQKHNPIYLELCIEFGALGGGNEGRIEAMEAIKRMNMKEESHIGEPQTMPDMYERGFTEDKPAHIHHIRR